MCEGGVAKHALRNGDVIAAEKGFVASPACVTFANVNVAVDGFTVGGIEWFAADGAVVVA
jgi:hypothetical protein